MRLGGNRLYTGEPGTPHYSPLIVPDGTGNDQQIVSLSDTLKRRYQGNNMEDSLLFRWEPVDGAVGYPVHRDVKIICGQGIHKFM